MYWALLRPRTHLYSALNLCSTWHLHFTEDETAELDSFSLVTQISFYMNFLLTELLDIA